MNITRARLFGYQLRLTHPLRLGEQVLECRSGLLIQLTDNSGHTVWGEAAPLPGFSPESLADAHAFLVALCRELPGKNLDPEIDVAAGFRQAAPSVGCALDMALLRLEAMNREMSLAKFLSPTASSTVPLARLITGESFDRAMDTRGAFEGPAVKLKVGGRPWQEDAQRVRRLAEAMEKRTRLRLDANRAWNTDEARQFVDHVKDISIEFLEEPLANPEELPDFAAETGCPIALDETLRDALKDPGAYSRILDAAAFLVWKPTITPKSPRELIACACAHKLPIVLSGAYESGVATAAYASYAAAFSPPGLAAGLDTYSRLKADVLVTGLPTNANTCSAEALEDAARSVDTSGLQLLWPDT